MLEHFRIPEDIAVRVDAGNLRSMTKDVFLKVGMSDSDATLATDVLLSADLKGDETHGVSNMLRAYVRMFNEGILNPLAKESIVRETPATAVLDGDQGLGIVTCPKAMKIAIQKAKNVGVGMVTIKNSGHAGMMGYHALLAAEEDMIGVAYTSGGNSMIPTWGSEAKLGTNPIAFAAPGNKEAPFCYDAANTAIAGNKIGLANRLGVELMAGWVANPDGSPDMSGTTMAQSFQSSSLGGERMQLPLGSTRELGSHKGYGLGVMVDIMCGLLSGAEGYANASPTRRSHYVAAYNIEAFVSVEEFKNDMDGMLQGLRETKPAPGHDRVVYAGMIEAEQEKERIAKGIPLHPEVLDWFKQICAEFSIEYTLG